MKVKKLTFFMTSQVVLNHGGSTKLSLLLWDSYSSCYGPKKIGDYPKKIWKMAIFWKLYTDQGQTACLLVKVVPFLIVITTPLTVFALFCPIVCYSSLNIGIFLLFLAIFESSEYIKITWSCIFKYTASNIHWIT